MSVFINHPFLEGGTYEVQNEFTNIPMLYAWLWASSGPITKKS